MLMSVFKCSFPCFCLFSNAVFHVSVCLQMQFSMLVSVFKCSFPCWCLCSNADFLSFIPLRVYFFMLVVVLTKSPLTSPHIYLPKSPTDNCHVTRNVPLLNLIYTFGHIFLLTLLTKYISVPKEGRLRAERCRIVSMLVNWC
jgi:hypothetical protein